MPAYEVEHIVPLTSIQQDALAEAITAIHSSKFSTPRLFVNVRFSNIESQPTYVAGKRKKANRIFAYVRHGPSRSQADYDAVSGELTKAWEKVVPGSELRLIMYYGAIVAGNEAGFSIPPAGGDKDWIKENLEKFQKKADDGDEDFKEMIAEIKERGFA